jgi:hypothetical protein
VNCATCANGPDSGAGGGIPGYGPRELIAIFDRQVRPCYYGENDQRPACEKRERPGAEAMKVVTARAERRRASGGRLSRPGGPR